MENIIVARLHGILYTAIEVSLSLRQFAMCATSFEQRVYRCVWRNIPEEEKQCSFVCEEPFYVQHSCYVIEHCCCIIEHGVHCLRALYIDMA